jgi:two-component system, NarL family, response regulator LiaR
MASTRVLVVDDVSQVRQDLCTVLRLTGSIEIVGEAANGAEAIRQAAALQPDVILMDLDMPILDGYEATRQIRASWPACRVVVLSVHGDAASRKKAVHAGVDAFIVKGAPVDNLVRAILNVRSTTGGMQCITDSE